MLDVNNGHNRQEWLVVGLTSGDRGVGETHPNVHVQQGHPKA